MDKNTSVCYSKFTKKLIITGIIAGIISVIVGLGIWIYRIQFNDIFTVKYVQWQDKIVVQTYNKGEKISFPDNPVQIGYDFIGWSLDKTTGQILTQEIVVEEELTLYAKWKESVYTLTYNNEEYSLSYKSTISINNNSIIIDNNNEQIIITPPNINGKKVIDWQISDGVNNVSVKDFTFKNIKSHNLTLIPVTEDIMLDFDILSSSEDYSITLSHDYKISQNDTLSLTLNLNENVNMSEIDIVSTSGNVVTEYVNGQYLISVNGFTEDFIIYINNIKVNIYSITYNNDGEALSQTFEYGQKITFPTPTKEGYSLIGWQDEKGQIYTEEDIVTSSLNLTALWEEVIYTISFPRNNGMYIININSEMLSSSKNIYRGHLDSVEFSVTLSKAYNNSDYTVYAITPNGTITPTKDGNNYLFENITSDMRIVVDNITLNTYTVIIDGKEQGSFSYGSWIYVDHNMISIRDSISHLTIDVETLIEDDNFGGWIANGEIVSNCIIQDIANNNTTIIISGDYSKKVTRVHLVSNGGNLDVTDIILVEGEEIKLPEPTKNGYKFAGWYTKLVEVNTIVDESSSVKFTGNTDQYTITLYAGWTK